MEEAADQRFTSAGCLVEEPLAGRCAERFLLSLQGVAADDVEHLGTHLVTALTELNRYDGHLYTRGVVVEWGGFTGGSIETMGVSEHRVGE